MGNRIHGNTSYEPLTTFLRLSLQSGRWTRMSKSKKMQKNRHQGWQLHLYGNMPPALKVQNRIWRKGSRRRRNHLFHILSKSVKGFPSCEGPKMGVFHWLWPSPLQEVSTTVLPLKLWCSKIDNLCFIVRWTEQRYDCLINGQAQAEIQQFMSVDHTTEEYTEVVYRHLFVRPRDTSWQGRRQDLLRWGAKLEISPWGTHGKLQGRVQQLLDD